MTTHQITGEPSNPWVTPTEPQPNIQRTTYDDGRPGIIELCGWAAPDGNMYVGTKADIVAIMSRLSPYQPGDVLELYRMCKFCEEPATYRSGIRGDLCRSHLGPFRDYHRSEPARRTVTLVTAEQRGDQFVWVVETEEL